MTFPNHPDIDETKLEAILDVCGKQHSKIKELQAALMDKSSRLDASEAEARDLRDQLYREITLRPSLEVLQRMANGIDEFDSGRFKCAMAALPHEVPKLSASVSMIGEMGIGAKLDFFNRQRQARERGLTVVEGGPGGPDPAA